MTSKLNIPTISRVSEVTDSKLRGLIGKKISKQIKFMNEDMTINKLVVSEVLQIQERAKEADKNEAEGFAVLRDIIKSACVDFRELTDAEFNQFPLDELTQLSNAIMAFSGIGANQGK